MVRAGIFLVVLGVWMGASASKAQATCGPPMCDMHLLDESCEPIDAALKYKALWTTPPERIRMKVMCSYSCQSGPPMPGDPPPAVNAMAPHSSDLTYRNETTGESFSLKALPESTCPGETLHTLSGPLNPAHRYVMLMSYVPAAPLDIYWHSVAFRAASVLLVLVTLDFKDEDREIK